MKILRIIVVFLVLLFSVNAQTTENNVLYEIDFVQDILDKHFGVASEDIFELAQYYAQFPEVVDFFKKIDRFPWKIKVGNTFETRSEISNFYVKFATVIYIPRTGFQTSRNIRCKKEIGLCRVSPTDALLHELIHVKLMFLNTTSYIKVKLGSLIQYENPHEMEVIRIERKFAKIMSARDKKKRPIRRRHGGAKPITVKCITCIE